MKKITLLMVALSLLLAFTGCNLKEKKLAIKEKKLEIIAAGISQEQMEGINEIIADAFDLYADSVSFGFGVRNDTLYFIDINKFSIDPFDFDLQKLFLLSALCSDSPDTKGLLAQIAEVPAVLQFIYVDSIEHIIYQNDIDAPELRGALSKEYTPHDVLNSYMYLANADFVEKGDKLSIEENYFVVNYYDRDYDIRSHIDSLKTEAMDEDYYDIINWDKYENKISKEIQDEAEFLCLFLIEEFYNHSPYIFNEIIKANLGFELRLSGEDTEKCASARINNNELHDLINE